MTIKLKIFISSDKQEKWLNKQLPKRTMSL